MWRQVESEIKIRGVEATHGTPMVIPWDEKTAFTTSGWRKMPDA